MKAAALALLALLPVAAFGQVVSDAPGGTLRWLDKVSGETADLDMKLGQSETRGRLTVQLDACRYPTDDPASDAFAHVTARDALVAEPVFSGWMIASSPALSALDHPRYDVWVLRCDAPAATPPAEGQ